MNDTFDRLSGLSIDDDSINSGKRGLEMDLKKTGKGGARKMANAWDLFEGKGGDIAPRKKTRETYSDLADEDEKEAVFAHSM